MKKSTIVLDKERTLVLDFNAMASFEEATGTSLFKLGQDLSATQLRALLWACLLHEDELLDIKTVGKFVTLQNMNEISEKLGEVMTNSFGQTDEPGQTEKN